MGWDWEGSPACSVSSLAPRSGERVGVRGPSPERDRGCNLAPSPRCPRGEGTCRAATFEVVISHHSKQPFSFPRRVFCARVLKLWLRFPPIEGWRSAESRRVLARHPLGLHLTRQARRLRGALRPITRDARLSALSPWRFWAPVARFPHRPCVRG